MSKWPQWFRGLCDLRVTLKNTSASWNENFCASPQNKYRNWNKWVNPAPWACRLFSGVPCHGGRLVAKGHSWQEQSFTTSSGDTRAGHKQARTSDRGMQAFCWDSPPSQSSMVTHLNRNLTPRDLGFPHIQLPHPPTEVAVSWEHHSNPHRKAPDLGSPYTHDGSCSPEKWTSLTFIIWIMLIHKTENGVTVLIFLYVKWNYCGCELLINFCS